MASTQQPQETWTNSWMCWTSDLLEEKDQSLDWDLTQISTTTSNTSLRLDQKPSGQFNDEWMDLPLDYGLNNLKEMKKEGLSFDVLEDISMLDPSMLANFDNSQNEDFLNNFMDLSEFLLTDQSLEETEEAENVIEIKAEPQDQLFAEMLPEEAVICEEVVPNLESMKRTIDDTDMDFKWKANIDHDYVTKKPRLSAQAVEETAKPSTSTLSLSKSLAQKYTPEQKYRERRNKNNVASRRSREIKKMKYSEMEIEANRLVIVNEELKERIAEMEKLAKEMKALLIKKLGANN